MLCILNENKKLFIMALVIFGEITFQPSYAQDITPEYIKQLNDKAVQDSKEIELPKLPDPNSKEAKAAQEIYNTHKLSIPALLNTGGEKGNEEAGYQKEQIYLFISSSMPTQTLKNYAKAIHENKLPVTMVMRGFVGDISKIKPTLDFINSFLVEGKKGFNASVQIDPLLFRRYGITHVPTFILAKNVNLVDPELSAGSAENNLSPVEAEKITGDVSLDYVMEKFKIKRIADDIKE